MKVRLRVTPVGSKPFLFEHPGPTFHIGRDPECELSFGPESGTRVSRRHARIELDPSGATIADAGSCNGTFLNDSLLVDPAPLRAGDRIRLGSKGPSLKVLDVDLTDSSSPDSVRAEVSAGTSSSSLPVWLSDEGPPDGLPLEGPAMPIRFQCEHCAQLLSISRSRIGTKVECPTCQARVLVPAAEAPAVVPAATAPAPAAAPAGVSVAAQPPPGAMPPSHPGRSMVPVLVAAVLLVGIYLLWDQGTRVAELSGRTTELASRVDSLTRQVTELTQKAAAPADRDPEFMRQAADLTESIGQLRKALEHPILSGVSPESAPTPEEKPPAPPAPTGALLGKTGDDAGDNVLVRRSAAETAWQRLRPNGGVRAGDTVTALPLSRGEVLLDSGMRLFLWGDVDMELLDGPVLESRVMLYEPARGIDLDLALERGRALVSNRKPEGSARVLVRFDAWTLEVTLPDAASEVALEMRTGYSFGDAVRLDDAAAPPWHMLTLVLRGRAALKSWKQGTSANAERFQYTCRREADVGHGWWTVPPRPLSGPLQEPHKQLVALLAEGSPVERLARPCADEGTPALVRLLALYGLAALDALSPLVDLLEGSRQAETRKATLFPLRCWLGRHGEHDRRLAEHLQQERKYSPEQARALLLLLHGSSKTERGKPETYARLIGWLEDERLGVRQAAWWRLGQYAPGPAAEVTAVSPYDPAAEPAKREAAVRPWKRLLEDKKLPAASPRPKE